MQWDETTPLSPDNLNDLEARIAQAEQNVEDGKGTIADAITDMGQSANATDTHAALAGKIRDISKDANAAEGDVEKGKTFYSGGQKRTGTLELTGDAADGDVLAGKTFYNTALKTKRTGTMPDRGNVNQTITTQGGQYTIPAGKHDGAGKVTAHFANLTPNNVRENVEVGGVVGTLVEGKRFAEGSVDSGQSFGTILKLTVRGLNFKPSTVTVATGNVPRISVIDKQPPHAPNPYRNVYYKQSNASAPIEMVGTDSQGMGDDQFMLYDDGFTIIVGDSYTHLGVLFWRAFA